MNDQQLFNQRPISAPRPPSSKKTLAISLLLLVIQLGTSSCTFIMESEFMLAGVSRVPRWFNFPGCTTAQQCQVQLSIFGEHTSTGFRTRIYGRDGRELSRVWPTNEGRVDRADLDGAKSGNRLADMYPSYEVMSFNGIREVFEFKRMEPIFYVVDDPDLIAKVMKALPPK